MNNLKDNLWSAYDFRTEHPRLTLSGLYRHFESLSEIYFEVYGETRIYRYELANS